MGDHGRLTGVQVTGAALVADGRAMHVSGFPLHAAPIV
jgi:hypothetical protein